VFLDFFVEANTGLEVLGELCEAGFEGPVVLLTGQGSVGISVDAMKAGATDYLVKGDMTPETLDHVLGNALQKEDMRKSLDENIHHLEETTDEIGPMRSQNGCVTLPPEILEQLSGGQE